MKRGKNQPKGQAEDRGAHLTVLPIAARIRKMAKNEQQDEEEAGDGTKLNDLDAKMAALERELAEGSDDDDDDDDEDDDDEDDDINGDGEGDEDEAILIKEGGVFKSRLAVEERIPPLPAHLLPLPECKGKGGGKAATSDSQPQRSSGLEATVVEMLRNYQPASLERLPFYCRVCRFQGKSVEDLAQHKKTALHKVAAEKERKMSYCRLCRKQFTSPEQLKGHLEGRPHQVLLESMMLKQGKKFVPRTSADRRGADSDTGDERGSATSGREAKKRDRPDSSSPPTEYTQREKKRRKE